jgi:formamidopyrimidine-DNA glycosylase
MPELPEVEAVARSLQKIVSGRLIRSAELHRPKLAPHSTSAEFAQRLAGRRINYVHRRGKHILFDLQEGLTLIVHLRMSGRFLLLAADHPWPKFAHAVFHLNGGETLVFDDQRHFGLMKIVPTAELYEAKEISKLAPEPFSAEFTPEYLYQITRNVRRKLKEFLIDQTKVCGLGNIYACEAMFAAGLDPRRHAGRLTRPSTVRLHESILTILVNAIDHSETKRSGGNRFEETYFNGSSNDGWSVYDRESKPCLKCGAAIVRIRQGGRSTYYCRTCQKK